LVTGKKVACLQTFENKGLQKSNKIIRKKYGFVDFAKGHKERLNVQKKGLMVQ